jgi:PPP family 3-phenylpropionic acid transporter
LFLQLLRLYYFLTYAAFGVYMPFFPRWFAEHGINGFRLSRVMLIYPLMGMLGPPIVGYFADKMRWRMQPIRIGNLLGICAFLSLACVPTNDLFLAAIITMFLFSSARIGFMMMADVVTVESVGKGYARIRLVGSIGFAVIAMTLGSLVPSIRTTRTALPLLVAFFLTLSLIVSLLFSAKPPAVPQTRVPDTAKGPLDVDARVLPWFLIATFIGQIGAYSFDMCWTRYLQYRGANEWQIGLAWGIGVAAEVTMMYFAPKVLHRSPAGLLTIAYVAATVRWTINALTTSVTVLLCTQTLHAFSFALMWVASVQLASRLAVGKSATNQGRFMSALGGGQMVGALMFGPLFDMPRGGTIVYLCAAGLSAAAATILWIARERLKTRPQMLLAMPISRSSPSR